jgi:4-azaleucine resistance transporter AzlC
MSASTDTKELRAEPSALSQAMPIILGYLSVGFAYGVLAVKAGLSVANTGLMSILVYAGSGQLIGVDMIGSGAPPSSVIATTFIVNLRHVLFSAALSPYLASWPVRRIARFCYQMTDETFALHATRFHNQQQNVSKTLAINALAHSGWIIGGIAGAIAGGFVPDVKPLGLDFALPAMFAVLLVGQFMTPAHILAAFLGGSLALIISQTGASAYATLVAAIVAAAAAAFTPWTKQQSS